MASGDDISMTKQQRRFETLKREITLAAREQGTDPKVNYRLRDAMRRAEATNMPDDLIEEARQQGGDDSDAPNWKSVTFEGYGPDGIAVLVQAITDDAQRSSSEIEELFEAHGGNLGEDGCVSWQFDRRGLVRVEDDYVDDDDAFMLEVIEMGAEELRAPVFQTREAGRVPTYRVYCSPNDVRDLDRALEDAGYPVFSASTQYDAKQRVEVTPERARNFLSFLEKLLGRADVANAYANWTVTS